ncbi:MAG: hypothetical protein ACR2OX_10420 [Methyloligellaceae bacterium]
MRFRRWFGLFFSFVVSVAFLDMDWVPISDITQPRAEDLATLDAPMRLAQLSVEFGGSEGDVKRSLERAGYTEVRITKSGFSSIRAQACYQGGRYVIKVRRFSGKISRGAKIGECRPVLDEANIIKRLRNNKYRRISIYAHDGDVFRLVACRRGRRFRMEVNHYGDTVTKDEVGRCRKQFNAAEIRQRLRDDGYNRIKLIGENDRRFVFQACEELRRVNLRVRRNGNIGRKRRVGRCSPPINHWNIPGLMEDRGYDRIVLVDKKLPVFVAEGCRDLKLVQVKFNRFGDILKETRTGDCDPPLTKDQVIDLIQKTGANRIQVEVDRAGNFVATSCHKFKLYKSRFDKYGKLFDQDVVGKCGQPPRLSEVLENFENRKLRDVQLFVEGCRRGRRIRFEINEYGEVKERKRVGRCR